MYQQTIIDGVADGSLPLSVVNSRVADVLRVRELLQLSSAPFTDPSRLDTDLDTAEARALALRIAQQSVVLLKNAALRSDGAPLLPLAPRVQSGGVRRIAVVGLLADVLNVGDYAGPFNQVNDRQSDNLLAALTARAAANGSSSCPSVPACSPRADRSSCPCPRTTSPTAGWRSASTAPLTSAVRCC